MDKPSLRILLVEDDDDDVIIIRTLLSESTFFQCSLDTTSSYLDALEAMYSNLYDVYLVDYCLGIKSGVDLIKEAIEKGCNSSIIVLTDCGDSQIDAAAMGAGAVDYLVKEQITTLLLERSIRYAIHHTQVEMDLRETEKKYHTLIKLSSAMRTASRRVELAPILIEQLLELLQANSAALLTFDRNKKDVVVEKGGGYWSSLTGTHLPLQEYIITRPIETGQPFTFNEILNEIQPVTPGSAGYTLAVTGVPLATAKEIIGALVVGREKAWGSEERSTLESIADMTTNALLRLGLYEDSQLRAAQLAMVNDLGRTLPGFVELPELFEKISDTVHHLLTKIDSLTITLHDPSSGKISTAYLVLSGTRQDAGRLPIVPTKGVENKTLREVILARKSLIVQGLPVSPQRINFSGETRSHSIAQQSGLYVPMLAKDCVIGVLELQSFTPNRFDKDDAELLSLVANTVAVSIENIRLFDENQYSRQELEQTYDATLEGWARALELRDLETAGHTERITDLTIWLASVVGVKSEELIQIRRGAIMHDVGKMGTPDSILLKPGPLTPEEWAIMRHHPIYGVNLLSPIQFLLPAMDIVLCHHEKWDGSGYPKGLKGKDIPLAARIFAIVDVWDALMSERPYKKAWSREDTMSYLLDQSGKHFDPKIVPVFVEMLGKGYQVS